MEFELRGKGRSKKFNNITFPVRDKEYHFRQAGPLDKGDKVPVWYSNENPSNAIAPYGFLKGMIISFVFSFIAFFILYRMYKNMKENNNFFRE